MPPPYLVPDGTDAHTDAAEFQAGENRVLLTGGAANLTRMRMQQVWFHTLRCASL